MGDQELLARAGDLEVRLASGPREIEAAQALRYRVFFEEGGAAPDAASRQAGATSAVSTRSATMCSRSIAARARSSAPIGCCGAKSRSRRFGFYSAAEFEVGALIARHPKLNFMELGRSCVAEGYRSKRTLETLWRGVWAYALPTAST